MIIIIDTIKTPQRHIVAILYVHRPVPAQTCRFPRAITTAQRLAI